AEKNELLDEKLEEQVKHIECAAYLHGSSTCNPYYICCCPLPSMQFMPLAAVDTSQDQVLHFYVHLRSVLTPQMRHVVETYGDYNYLRTRVGLDETVGEYKWMTYPDAGRARLGAGSGLVHHGIPKAS
ncbi:hypothetical protein Tco_1286729, partial [Tanacetum coccineum]